MLTEIEIKELKEAATEVRRNIVKMVHNSKSGHPGGYGEYFCARGAGAGTFRSYGARERGNGDARVVSGVLSDLAE